MSFINSVIRSYFGSRLREIDFFRKHPILAQQEAFRSLATVLGRCAYGREWGVTTGISYEQFAARVPVVTYDDFSGWITRAMQGECNVIWDKDIRWFSKSSGTTSSVSKFLPVPDQYLSRGHLQGGRDVLAVFIDNYPDTTVLKGKTLTLGGSLDTTFHQQHKVTCGDISAIMMSHTPWYARFNRVPSPEVAVMKDFNDKIEGICRECVGKNVTSFAGVPSWNMVMLEKVLAYTGKSNVCEVWPNMELFVHGGVAFDPYRAQYQRLIPSQQMKYMETYNASEGFFAIQDDPMSKSMLLMLDYGIFYEFLPMKHYGDYSKVVPLEGVSVGEDYAMIITTEGGLWRYEIGDTVRFTSLSPHKIEITGRTKLFINCFGEEIVIENAEKALAAACRETGAEISEYMAAPVYMEIGSRGAHQWVLEFSTPPSDLFLFATLLDSTLQAVNSDYAAKRHLDTTLTFPEVSAVEKGSFYGWFAVKGKLGGQHKVPRLSNNRQLMDEFLTYMNKR